MNFAGMVGFERVFWIIALPFTVVLLIQFLLSLLGIGGDHGGDQPHSADHDMSSFKLMTVRNAVAFFAMFGWSGIAMIHSGAGKIASFSVAFVIGLATMFLVSAIFLGISKLEQKGNPPAASLINRTGVVYLTIPADGTGKVNVNGPSMIIEMKARSKGGEIPTGAIVKVTEVVDGVAIVEKA